MKNLVLLIFISFFGIFLPGCITPEVTTNTTVYEEPNKLNDLNIAVMPLLAKELKESEIEDLMDDIVDELADYGNIKQIVIPDINEKKIYGGWNTDSKDRLYIYENSRVVGKLINNNLKDKWVENWNNYLSKKILNNDVMQEICNTLNVNSILQFAITDIKRTRPIHRKVIGETSAEVSYTLFSSNGTVLLEGKSVASQANAWSGQMTPRPIDVIELAIEDIFDKFPFNGNY